MNKRLHRKQVKKLIAKFSAQEHEQALNTIIWVHVHTAHEMRNACTKTLYSLRLHSFFLALIFQTLGQKIEIEPYELKSLVFL